MIVILKCEFEYWTLLEYELPALSKKLLLSKINEKGKIEPKDSQREGWKYAVVAARTPPRRTQFPVSIGQKKGWRWNCPTPKINWSNRKLRWWEVQQWFSFFLFVPVTTRYNVRRRDGGDERLLEKMNKCVRIESERRNEVNKWISLLTYNNNKFKYLRGPLSYVCFT